MARTTSFALAVLCFLFATVATARIINVPEDRQTIQAGVDASQNGDTVLVQPGEYEENVAIGTKGIVLGSLLVITGDLDYIDETIINGGRRDCAVTIIGNDNFFGQPQATLRGFTVTNGESEVGGGVRIAWAHPELVDLVIRNNFSREVGGGVYGAIWNPTMRRVKVFENEASRVGGVYFSTSQPTLIDCEIFDNVGSGFCAVYSTSTLSRSTFVNNSGIGIALVGGFPNNGSTSFLDHVTVCGNSSGITGELEDMPDLTTIITNSIIRDNSNDEIYITGSGGDVGEPCYSRMEIAFSNLKGGRDGVRIGRQNYSQLTWNEGNIDTDPLFVDAENSDYHLSADSPCIDAGDPDSHDDPDLTRADMGAFYYHPNWPPEVVAPIEDVVVDEDCDYVAIADLDRIFFDPNGDELRFGVEGLELLGLTIDQAGVLGIQPALHFNGEDLNVNVFAFNTEDTVAIEFLVTVNAVNDAPGQFNLISPNRNEFEWFYPGDTIRFDWAASVDPDSETVRYLLRLDVHYGAVIDSISIEADTLTFCYLSDTINVAPLPPDGQQINVVIGVSWWVVAISGADSVRSDSTFFFAIGPGGVNETEFIPSSFSLSAFPNPFNSSTRISFSLGARHAVPLRLAIYDLSGRLVADLLPGRGGSRTAPTKSVEHSVVWNADGLPGGIYIIRLESGNETRTMKTLLIK